MNIEHMYVDKEGLWYSEESEMVRIPVKLVANNETIWTEIGYSYFPKKEFTLVDTHIGPMTQEEVLELIQEDDSFVKARAVVEEFATKKSGGVVRQEVEIVSCKKVGKEVIKIDFNLGNEEGIVRYKKSVKEGVSPLSLEMNKPYMGFTKDVFQLVEERARLFLLLHA